ncbi:hypothetical protein HK100_005534 [Physocladia obscura]|uniref:Uncharacterized protein n=1 Tax=Physocladia obscura TaxID=109957 RepID=A0AAD5SU46_9FUNG|nr:hypothetical protein HK100_005534 [Physocladia obscura]
MKTFFRRKSTSATPTPTPTPTPTQTDDSAPPPLPLPQISSGSLSAIAGTTTTPTPTALASAAALHSSYVEPQSLHPVSQPQMQMPPAQLNHTLYSYFNVDVTAIMTNDHDRPLPPGRDYSDQFTPVDFDDMNAAHPSLPLPSLAITAGAMATRDAFLNFYQSRSVVPNSPKIVSQSSVRNSSGNSLVVNTALTSQQHKHHNQAPLLPQSFQRNNTMSSLTSSALPHSQPASSGFPSTAPLNPSEFQIVQLILDSGVPPIPSIRLRTGKFHPLFHYSEFDRLMSAGAVCFAANAISEAIKTWETAYEVLSSIEANRSATDWIVDKPKSLNDNIRLRSNLAVAYRSIGKIDESDKAIDYAWITLDDRLVPDGYFDMPPTPAIPEDIVNMLAHVGMIGLSETKVLVANVADDTSSIISSTSGRNGSIASPAVSRKGTVEKKLYKHRPPSLEILPQMSSSSRNLDNDIDGTRRRNGIDVLTRGETDDEEPNEDFELHRVRNVVKLIKIWIERGKLDPKNKSPPITPTGNDPGPPFLNYQRSSSVSKQRAHGSILKRTPTNKSLTPSRTSTSGSIWKRTQSFDSIPPNSAPTTPRIRGQASTSLDYVSSFDAAAAAIPSMNNDIDPQSFWLITPHLVATVMNLCTGTANLRFTQGRIALAIKLHEACLEVAHAVMNAQIIGGGCNVPSDSWIGRECARAKSRSLSGIAVCLERCGDVHRGVKFAGAAVSAILVTSASVPAGVGAAERGNGDNSGSSSNGSVGGSGGGIGVVDDADLGLLGSVQTNLGFTQFAAGRVGQGVSEVVDSVKILIKCREDGGGVTGGESVWRALGNVGAGLVEVGRIGKLVESVGVKCDTTEDGLVESWLADIKAGVRLLKRVVAMGDVDSVIIAKLNIAAAYTIAGDPYGAARLLTEASWRWKDLIENYEIHLGEKDSANIPVQLSPYIPGSVALYNLTQLTNVIQAKSDYRQIPTENREDVEAGRNIRRIITEIVADSTILQKEESFSELHVGTDPSASLALAFCLRLFEGSFLGPFSRQVQAHQQDTNNLAGVIFPSDVNDLPTSDEKPRGQTNPVIKLLEPPQPYTSGGPASPYTTRVCLAIARAFLISQSGGFNYPNSIRSNQNIISDATALANARKWSLSDAVCAFENSAWLSSNSAATVKALGNSNKKQKTANMFVVRGNSIRGLLLSCLNAGGEIHGPLSLEVGALAREIERQIGGDDSGGGTGWDENEERLIKLSARRVRDGVLAKVKQEVVGFEKLIEKLY